jgi:hypothetical protein
MCVSILIAFGSHGHIPGSTEIINYHVLEAALYLGSIKFVPKKISKSKNKFSYKILYRFFTCQIHDVPSESKNYFV